MFSQSILIVYTKCIIKHAHCFYWYTCFGTLIYIIIIQSDQSNHVGVLGKLKLICTYPNAVSQLGRILEYMAVIELFEHFCAVVSV